MTYIRYRHFRDEDLAAMAHKYASAEPFPHLVIDDFLSARPDDVLRAFPAGDDPYWNRESEPYEAGKMSWNDLERIPDPLASIIRELTAPAFLNFIEVLTGIRGLLLDPYMEGAGLHVSGPGGVSVPHIDAHYSGRLRIYRRINLLLYLNRDWQESDGGCLGLYDRRDRMNVVHAIVPRWGTCLVFRSDGDSLHGFTQPVAAHRTRRAIAMYYYTSLETTAFSGGLSTVWWPAGGPQPSSRGPGGLHRAQFHLYRSLRFASKAFAYLAHRTRPRVLTAAAESPPPGQNVPAVKPPAT